VEVTFRGLDGLVVTAGTDLTERGAARIAVPPFVQMRSGQFSSGTVTVSIAGVASARSLAIEAPPGVDADPGDLTVDLLDFAIEKLFEAVDDAEDFEDETGTDQSELVDALFSQIDILIEMSDEIFFDGRLTIGTSTGPAVIAGSNLANLDRLLAAPFVAEAAAAGAALGAGRSTGSNPLLTRAGWADVLEQAQDWGVGGMQCSHRTSDRGRHPRRARARRRPARGPTRPRAARSRRRARGPQLERAPGARRAPPHGRARRRCR
jgi:hypothetical protein